MSSHLPASPARLRLLLLGCVLTLLAGCSLLDRGAAPAEEAGGHDRLAVLEPGASLTPSGVDLAAARGLATTAPRYHVTASVEPGTGRVAGTVRASLPVAPEAEDLRLRYFAGLPSFATKPRIGRVEVDGAVVAATREASIVTVPLPESHGDRVALRVPFSYTLPETDQGSGLLGALEGLGGGGLTPSDIGLLSRHPDVVNLGHWFPVRVPEGNSADPVPDGFGDIGNFPAAMISMELSVPRGWSVIDGGVRVDEERRGDRWVVRSEGAGMRDLVVSVVRGYTSARQQLDGPLSGVTVAVHGPADAAGELDAVLAESVAALETLSADFGAYPWREFDVVSAPLGSGVGGMEWPGAVWIESSMFAGGIPGLGDLGLPDGALEDMLGEGGLLEGMLGASPEGAGTASDLALTLRTVRAWTIAHEAGHEWWHILVGNDSVEHPVVDEPLAQYSACRALRGTVEGTQEKAQRGDVCAAHIRSVYAQMRALGHADAAADRATDRFTSSLQYAGLVYGKAAWFYLALEKEFGADAVGEALAAVVEEHAFSMLTGDELQAALGEHLGDAARVDALWRHWVEEKHGDADLGAPEPLLPGLEGLGELGGLGGDPGGPDALGSPGGEGGQPDPELDELLELLEKSLREQPAA